MSKKRTFSDDDGNPTSLNRIRSQRYKQMRDNELDNEGLREYRVMYKFLSGNGYELIGLPDLNKSKHRDPTRRDYERLKVLYKKQRARPTAMEKIFA
jgi:hypothetical protein